MTDYTWNNGAGGSWSNNGDWIGGIPNSATADVTISLAGAYTVSLPSGAAYTVDSVVFDNSAASFTDSGTISLGGTLGSFTFDGNQFLLGVAGLVSGGVLDIDSGTLLDDGGKLQTKQFTLGENGTIALNGKALTLAGAAVLDGMIEGNNAAGNTLVVAGNASINFSAPEYVGNNATLLVTGTLTENFNSGLGLNLGNDQGNTTDTSSLIIKSGGVFNLQGNGVVAEVDGDGSIANAGVLEGTDPVGDYISAYLVNTGTILSVAGNELLLTEGGAIGGTLAGAGEVDFNAGSFALSPSLATSIATLGFETGATVQLGANITLANTADFLGGTISLAGHSLTLGGNDDLNGVILGTGGSAVSQIILTGTAGGAGLDFEDNATLVDAGTFILNPNGGYDLEFGNFSGLTDSSALTIKAGAVLDMAGTPQNTMYADAITEFDGSGTIANAGLLEATGYAGAFVDPFINSTGTLLATAGADLILEGGGTIGGKLTGAGEIGLDSGTFTLSPTLSVSVGTLGFNGGVVALGGNVSIAGAGAVIDGAVIDLNGHNLTLNNPVLVSGNDITGAGKVIVLGNATFSNYVVTNGETLVDAGTITETSGGNLQLGLSYPDSATLAIDAGAIYKLNQPGPADIGGPGGDGAVINAGLLDAMGGGAIDSYVINTGNIESNAADLQLQNGGNLGGKLTGSGEIDFDGGQFTLSPTIADSVATLGFLSGAIILGGNLNLTASTLTGNDDVRETGGTIALNGHNVTLGSGALGINGGIYGPGTAIVVGRVGFESMGVGNGATLTDAGTITQTSEGQGNLLLGLSNNDTGTLLIRAGATYDLVTAPSGAFADISDYGVAPGFVINSGLLDSAYYSGTNGNFVNAFLDSTGTIESDTGPLQLEDGGTIGGTLTGAGEIDFSGGQFTLSPTIADSVATLGFLSGAIILGGNLNLTASTLTGNDDVRETGGTIALNGHNATLGSGWLGINAGIYGSGTAMVTGSIGFESMLVGGGATLADAGTITETGGLEGNLQLGQTATDPGTLLIESGGTFNLLTDIVQYSQGYGDGLVVNAGLLDVAGGAFPQQIQVYLVNTGTLEAKQVDLQLQGGGKIGGTLAGSGEIEINGGNFTLAPGLVSDAAILEFDGGSVSILAGNVDLTGGVLVSGADIALNGHTLTLTNAELSGDGTISGPGTVIMLGTAAIENAAGNVDSGFNFVGGVTIAVAGTFLQENGYGDNINLGTGAGDTATLLIESTGTYDLATEHGNYDTQIEQNSASGTVINDGLIDSNYDGSYGAANVIAATLVNAGTIESDLGQFQLEDGGSIGGVLTGAGEIDLTSGVFNLAPNLAINVATLGISAEAVAGGNLSDAKTFNLQTGGELYLNGNVFTLSGAAALDGEVNSSGDLKITGQAVATGLFVGGNGELEDAGTITQTGNVQLGISGSDGGTLAIDAGATYDLENQGGNATDLTEDGAAIGITNAGLLEVTGYSNGAAPTDIAAPVRNTGTIADLGAGSVQFEANVDNDRLITVSSTDYPVAAASVDFDGALTADAGETGTVALGANAVLYAAGAVAGQKIAFTTAGTLGSELQIGDFAGFSGTVAGFAGGDVVDLEGVLANGETYANGVLTLTETTSGSPAEIVGTLAMQSFTGTLALASDGNGGTEILLNEPAKTYSNPATAPTTSTWFGAAGNFSTAADWSPSGQPGSNAIALINGSNSYTIAYAETDTVYQLQNNDSGAKLYVEGGRLTVEDGGYSFGTLQVNGANFDALTGFDFYGLVSLASNGTLEADTGSMLFGGGAVLAGTIAGDGRLDGSLDFAGGNVLLNAGFTVQAGAASLDFTGAAVTLGANLGFAAPVEIEGSNFDLAGHALALSGASALGAIYEGTAFSGTGTLAITGTAALGNLSVEGNVNLVDAGLVEQNNYVVLGDATTDPSSILIAAGGTYALEDDASVFGISDGGAGSLKNAGLLEMTGYGDDADSIALPVLNTGTILAAEGDLQLSGGGTLGGTYGGGAGTVALINGYAIAAGKTESATFAAGGQFGLASGTSQMSLTGPGTFVSAGTLTIADLGDPDVSGNWALSIGTGLTWKNTGTVNDFGEIILGQNDGDTATISNTGTWNLADSNASLIQYGGPNPQPYVFTNAGLLENSGTIGASGGNLVDAVEATVTNTGTILATTGALDVDFVANDINGTLAGGTWAVANATLELLQGGPVTTDAADIILNGPAATLCTGSTPTAIESSLTNISTGGTLQLLAGRGFDELNPVTDSGTIILGGGVLSDAVTFANTGDYGFSINTGGLLEGFGEAALVVRNNGEILANAPGQALDVVFTAAYASGTGTLGIAAGATLALGGIVGNGQTISFAGPHGVLVEQPGIALSGTLAGLAPGDTIDIATTTVSAASFSGANLDITLSGGTVLDQALIAPITGERFAISSDGGTGSDLAVYRAAVGTVAPDPVVFGNVHVGATVSAGLTIANTQPADGYSEALDASFSSTSGSITAAGSVTTLAAGASSSSALTIGLLTGAAGSVSGAAVITLASDGAGTDGDPALSLGSQTIAVSGAVFADAGPGLGASTLALGQVHTNAADTAGVTLYNLAANPAYTEALDASFSGTSGAVLASGTVALLAPNTDNSNNLIATLATGTAGLLSGTATLALESDGTGIDGLGTTALAAQTITLTGAVFNLATAAALPGTISLGQHHLGAASAQVLTLANAAAPGPYSENLDAAFSATLTTGNFSTAGHNITGIAAGASATPLTLSLGGTAGNVLGAIDVTLSSDGAGIDTLGVTSLGIETVAVTGTVFNEATAALTATTLSLGQHHAGVLNTAALTLKNSAAPGAYSENLDARFTGTSLTAGSFSTGGTIALLAAGASSSALAVTLAGAGGVISGHATLGLTSDGTGIDTLGLTALSPQTIAVTGTLFNEATAGLAATLALGQFHAGAAGLGTLAIANTAPAELYSEGLDASLSGTSFTHGSFAVAGAISQLAAGGTGALAVSLATGTAGTVAGVVTLALKSDGTGIDTLGTTALASKTEAVTATVFAYAAPTLASTVVNFGIVHAGSAAAQDLSLSNANTAPGYTESLDASFTGTSNGFAGTGSVALLKAGATNSTSLALSLASTATAGILSGTATLGLTSDGTGIDTLGTTSLASQIITLTGTIDNYATAALEQISGAGTLTGAGSIYLLSLGNIQQGAGSLTANLGVLNAATGVADLLGGSFVVSSSGGFTDTGFGTFTGLGAGQADTAPSITLSAATAGAFSEFITLSAAGSNASGYKGALQNITLDVTGNVLHTYTLTSGADTIAGAGNDLIIARAGQLSAGDIINAGTGTNILTLAGGGVFDMRAPATLTGVSVVEAQENIGTAAQTLYLDAGFTGTLNASSGPAGSSLTVYGNLDSATVDLGNGNDTVFVGSSLETINAGGGNDVFFVASGDAGATLNGGSGVNTLAVAGGSSFVMGGNISSISNVVINELSGQSETFVANSIAGLAITGGAGNDTITLGAATQSVVTGTGNTVIDATAAEAGAAITTEGSATLDLTTGGNATLNAGDDFLTVSLATATNLTLSPLSFITAIAGPGADTITALAAEQTLVGGSGIDTLIGYAGFGDLFLGTAGSLNADTIQYFGGNDLIDLTNIARAGAVLAYSGSATNGTLSVSGGGLTTSISLSSGTNLAQSRFHMTSDGHGGTNIALI